MIWKQQSPVSKESKMLYHPSSEMPIICHLFMVLRTPSTPIITGYTAIDSLNSQIPSTQKPISQIVSSKKVLSPS